MYIPFSQSEIHCTVTVWRNEIETKCVFHLNPIHYFFISSITAKLVCHHSLATLYPYCDHKLPRAWGLEWMGFTY